jgi:hypothetical protein
VREALGLEPRLLDAGAPRRHVVVASPRARAWARPLVLEHALRGEAVALLDAPPQQGGSQPLELDVHAQDFAGKARLPRAPGPFGGTTVLVLPDELAAEEVEAWKSLAQDDPLAKQSRFHRLVLASLGGEQALPLVLAELAAKNRRNVLIVPAVWCADGARMRALQRAARGAADGMTLHWRPGLGGLGAP